MTDEATFESIDQDDAPGIGPAAVLLAGYGPEADAPVVALLTAAGALGHRVLRVTREMLQGTLAMALGDPGGGAALGAAELPRVAILSGLSGRQLHAVIDGWRETGLPRPIWASTTPNNLTFGLRDLLKELLAEQRAMAERAAKGSPGA